MVHEVRLCLPTLFLGIIFFRNLVPHRAETLCKDRISGKESHKAGLFIQS